MVLPIEYHLSFEIFGFQRLHFVLTIQLTRRTVHMTDLFISTGCCSRTSTDSSVIVFSCNGIIIRILWLCSVGKLTAPVHCFGLQCISAVKMALGKAPIN